MSRTFSSLAVFAMAATISITPASAADLSRGPAITPEPYEYREAEPRWAGFYLGLTYGYATGWTDVNNSGAAFDVDIDGGNGTAFVGYNWQFGRAVAGLEADIGTGNLGGHENDVTTEISHFGSIRGRLGYLFTPDFLVYGTAGFAYANYDFASNGSTQSETLTGYQIGGGTELKFSDPWSLRLEYVYTDLDAQTLSHKGVAQSYEPDFHTVRAGLSYKF